MTIYDSTSEAKKLLSLGDTEAEEWLADFNKAYDSLPGKIGETIKHLTLSAFKAGFLKGIERTSELVARRIDELPPPAQKNYGDGEGGPTS